MGELPPEGEKEVRYGGLPTPHKTQISHRHLPSVGALIHALRLCTFGCSLTDSTHAPPIEILPVVSPLTNNRVFRPDPPPHNPLI